MLSVSELVWVSYYKVVFEKLTEGDFLGNLILYLSIILSGTVETKNGGLYYRGKISIFESSLLCLTSELMAFLDLLEQCSGQTDMIKFIRI